MVLALSASASAGEGIVPPAADAATSVAPPGDPAPGFAWGFFAAEMLVAGIAAFIIVRGRLYRPVPARLTPAEPQPIIPPVILLVGALVLFLAELLGSLTATHLLELDLERGTLGDHALAMLGHYGGFIAGILVLSVMIPGITRAVGLRFEPRDAASGVVGAALIIPVVLVIGGLGAIAASLIASWSGAPPPEPTAHEGLLRFVMSDDPATKWLFAALVVIGAPVAEETIYRGMIQTAFLRASRSPSAAILLASAIFTMMHVPIVEWFALPAIFALSIGLGVVAERTKRLAAPIIIHALFNLLNLGLALYGS